MPARMDYTRQDYASLLEGMLDLARDRLPEWTDQSPSDLGVVLVELFASMGDALFYHQDRIAAESYLDTAVERRSVLHLLRLIGYELRPPQPASADLTLIFDKDARGTVQIAPGCTFTTTREATGQVVKFQYVRAPLTITLDALEDPDPQGGTGLKRYPRLPVVQVDDSIATKNVASSDGTPGQRYALAGAPLIDDSLVLFVDEGGGPNAWVRRTSFLESTRDDPHYLVRRDENDVAWIEFPDGRSGKVPARGKNNITATYRIGGGTKGNVPPSTISKAETSIPFLKFVYNQNPASGGTDAEPIAEAVARGPQQFRSRGRAVTAADYEFHARAFGVAKARAWKSGTTGVDLVVAPAGGGPPSDTLIVDLGQYLETRRMITTVLRVSGPQEVDVKIEGTLTVEPRFIKDQVRQRVENAVRDLWSFDRVDFGDTLYISKIYEAVESIEGVRGVNISTFVRADGNPATGLPADGKLSFGARELPRSTGFTTPLKVEVGRPHV